jgi:ribonuclease HI
MIIYTDGSCHPNPGPGGYGVVVFDDNNNLIECYSHQEKNTTNNIQEIKAILYTFLNYGININNPLLDIKIDIPVVYSDSNYCVQTFTNWMFAWERKGWLKSDNTQPENLELIKAYYDWYNKGYRIDLKKIKGHKGILGNELADKLATNKLSVEEVKNGKY